MFSRVAMDQFKVEPDWNGMIMSYIGIISMVIIQFTRSLSSILIG